MRSPVGFPVAVLAPREGLAVAILAMRFHPEGLRLAIALGPGEIALTAKALAFFAFGALGARPAGPGLRRHPFGPRRLAVLDTQQKPVAQLVAQHLALHLDHRPRFHVIEPERAVADPDQPVHRHADFGHRAADLAVLALADAHGQPGIGALLAVKADFHRLEILALDGDAAAQGIKGLGRRPTIHPHAVFAQPAGFRQLEPPLQPAVIGQKQQAFGIEVKPADVQHPRHFLGHLVENRAPALFVLLGRHQAQRFVIKPKPGFLRRVDRLAVDHHLVRGLDVQRGAGDLLAVHRHPARKDHLFRIAARGDARARNHLGDALGGIGGFFGGNGSKNRTEGGFVRIGHFQSFKGRGRATIAGEGTFLHLLRRFGKRLDRTSFAGDERRCSSKATCRPRWPRPKPPPPAARCRWAR
ncbi:hypothetical protein AP073_12340 [Rhodobacter capsulatus]|nr:hypothetical protein AP073_12340 [Rhodobacter capsulatus]